MALIFFMGKPVRKGLSARLKPTQKSCRELALDRVEKACGAAFFSAFPGNIFDKSNSSFERRQMKRFGMVVGVTEGKLDEYRQLHKAVWPEVLKRISESHIRNFSIYSQKMPDGKNCLFSYYEYTGSDYEKDMAEMAADKTTLEFWKLCRPCQVPFAECKEGQWWTVMEEVFHHN